MTLSTPRIIFALALAVAFSLPVSAAEKSTAPQLIELAESPGAALREAIAATFEEKDLKEGTAWAGRGPDFFFVLHASAKPQLLIDDATGPQMHALDGSDLWYA